jgi:hypothetical protein
LKTAANVKSILQSLVETSGPINNKLTALNVYHILANRSSIQKWCPYFGPERKP